MCLAIPREIERRDCQPVRPFPGTKPHCVKTMQGNGNQQSSVAF